MIETSQTEAGFMTTDPGLMSATALADHYRRHLLSPVEVTEAVLARIARLDTQTNAICHVDAESALAAARASEARYRAGTWLSPVDGVPATVKDLLLTIGWPTLRGSKAVDPGQAWIEDAPTVARLREAGAVLVAKTTTPEFGWKAVTDCALTGITRNPWDLQRTSGGSSGGAAVAAALGFGALNLGTDGGGSIRIPAAFTGVFGLKPSYGRVPAYPASPFAAVAHVGPITRTVTDAARMLNILARPDARDGLALPYDGRDWTIGLDDGIAGWRIGFARTINDEAVEPSVAAAVDAAALRFEDLGAHVDPLVLSLPGIGHTFGVHWQSGAAALLEGFTPEQRALIDPGLQAMAETGGKIRAADYVAAARARDGYALAVNQLFERYDLIVTPTVPIAAFEAGRNTPASGPYANWQGWTPFSYPFNLSRHPAASIPCGFAHGLPVGLQLVGPSHRDDKVLRAARAFESLMPIALPTL
jgi:aspartyl-tRNA(Asn)/glutamyl-tRNA(Gln) amidotransferase subunit A